MPRLRLFIEHSFSLCHPARPGGRREEMGASGNLTRDGKLKQPGRRGGGGDDPSRL